MVTHFQLRPSWQLASLISVLYGGACLILLKMPLVSWLKIIGLIVTLSHLCYLWSHLIQLNSTEAIIVFWQTYTGEWRLVNRQGLVKNAQLETHISFCTQHFIILNFKVIEMERLTTRPQTILILPDSLSQTDFKTLRRLLFFNKI